MSGQTTWRANRAMLIVAVLAIAGGCGVSHGAVRHIAASRAQGRSTLPTYWTVPLNAMGKVKKSVSGGGQSPTGRHPI
jgi:hypothetical protein